MGDDAAVPHLDRVEVRIVSGLGAGAGLRIETELIEVAVLARTRMIDLEDVRPTRERSRFREDLAREPVADHGRAAPRLVRLRRQREDVGVTEGLLARIARELVAGDLDEPTREAELLHDRREVGDRVVLGGDGDLDTFDGICEDAIARRHRGVGAEDRVLVEVGTDVARRVDDATKDERRRGDPRYRDRRGREIVLRPARPGDPIAPVRQRHRE